MSTIDSVAGAAGQAQEVRAARALAVRTWTGFVCVPLVFVSMLSANLLVGSAGDGAPAAELAAFGHGGGAQALPFVELLSAVALVGLANFFGASIRRRGALLATIGMGLTIVGAMGSAMVSVRHFYDIALAAAPRAVALHVLDGLDAATGPLPFLMISLAPIAGLVLLAVAAFRAGCASIVALALSVAFAVLEFTPLPESVGLLVGGVAFTWMAVRLLRERTA